MDYNTNMITVMANEGSEHSRRRTLGGAGKTLRVYTFSGGGFDTSMQLGVVHALLTAGYEKPDLVTGVSAGAITAVALAEVLGAGTGKNAKAKHAAQVSKFREILEAYRDGPFRLLMAQLPDGYERKDRQVTENLQLPIHLAAEREGREQAQRAEAGLIRLINELLAIDLPMRQAVLLTRIFLGVREARECSGRLMALYELASLYGRLLLNLNYLALLFGRIAWLLIRLRDDPPKPCPARRVLFRQQSFRRRAIDNSKRFLGAIVIITLPIVGGLVWLGSKIKEILNEKARKFFKPILQPFIPQRWWNHFFSTRCGEECVRSILAHYALSNDLGDANALRELFVELFDPDYFGVRDMEAVGEAALRREKFASEPKSGERKPLTLEQFATEERGGITVAVLAADIDRSKVCPVPADTAVVDALMAATAIVPIFSAVGLPVFPERDGKGNDLAPPEDTVFYIDGENVNADPLRPTIKLLQKKIDFKTRAVRFYSCVPFPISQQELPTERQFRELVGVTVRSLQLQRLQNALLERNFIKLYRETLQMIFQREAGVPLADIRPDGQPIAKAVLDRTRKEDGDRTGEHKPLIAADVVSIEADRPLRLNERIPAVETHEERRMLIDQAVADGCRATLTAWLASKDEPLHVTGVQLRKMYAERRYVSCRRLIATHLERTHFVDVATARPESDRDKGPGFCEVCRSCRFYQKRQTPDGKELDILPGFELPAASDPVVARPTVANVEAPATKGGQPDLERPGPLSAEPTVSLLFSGGVFRGVYQIGVANALLMLNLRPNIVAGASVGSITAALLAEIFSEPNQLQRSVKMSSLATSFLALDRLILTDRFYDFVRRFTLCGGDSEFSLRDLDLLLRRYDEGHTAMATDRARRTIAGLERLFYISPFELNELVRAQRLQDYSKLYKMIGDTLQELLDRNGATLEILGAEPLALLLNEHVLRCHPGNNVPRFDLYAEAQADRSIHLLATVTNLTKGKLRTLGSPYLGDRELPVLREGLLASSAFPGVFRPRNSWEIFPTSSDQDQYVDGGVMDNLPFASVVAFLDVASKPNSETGRDPIYLRRPVHAPHLIVTGSLEPNCHRLGPRRTNEVRKCWVTLKKRAGQIRYNKKIHDFEVAERDMHQVWEGAGFKPGDTPNEPLDIEVVAVKPEWLCGTFAFHPMLGFKRRRQAASIAHGCAGTLKEMKRLWDKRAKTANNSSANGYFWEMDTAKVKEIKNDIQEPKSLGKCWFCDAITCPFSEVGLKQQDPNIRDRPATHDALVSIYHECGKAKTHQVQSS